MSTLVTQTISNGSVSTSSANVIQGSAKAWVNFNGTGTVAINGSYNVSSITDNGTGDYTVNFTNAFADANYSVSGMTQNDNEMGVMIKGPYNGSPTTMTTTALRIVTAQGGPLYDCTNVCVQVFR
jgi:hypothetical protein